MKWGFRKIRLTFSLDKHLSRIFFELLARASHYIDAEEATFLLSKEVADDLKVRKVRHREPHSQRSTMPPHKP